MSKTQYRLHSQRCSPTVTSSAPGVARVTQAVSPVHAVPRATHCERTSVPGCERTQWHAGSGVSGKVR
jgi:hypothetical protein